MKKLDLLCLFLLSLLQLGLIILKDFLEIKFSFFDSNIAIFNLSCSITGMLLRQLLLFRRRKDKI